jgi:hypothetical protein
MAEEIHPAGIFWRLAISCSRKTEIIFEVGILECGMEPFDT